MDELKTDNELRAEILTAEQKIMEIIYTTKRKQIELYASSMNDSYSVLMAVQVMLSSNPITLDLLDKINDVINEAIQQ